MIETFNTTVDEVEFEQKPLSREDYETRRKVGDMIREIRREGWPSVVEYSEEFDDVTPSTEPVDQAELQRCWDELSDEAQDALKDAKKRIGRYQEELLPSSQMFTELTGGVLGDLIRPVSRAGCYVPGGRVPLPSSVLMTAYVAEIAGVEEVVICSPPVGDQTPHDLIKATASLLESPKVYGLGGVQAVGAMAYGTEEIPGVDIVAGAGNIYVTLAKREVYGDVEVDLLAGPSEIAVIAEKSAAKPHLIAADLLSQAEHDPRSRAYLFSPQRSLVGAVRSELEDLVSGHQREDVIRKSFENSGLVVTTGLDEAVELSNSLAPEHLEIHTDDPISLVDDCVNAGAIFCGDWSPEAFGDYVAGPSHILPTGGSARFFSPLSVHTFLRHQSLISLTEGDYREAADSTETLAGLESLPAHRYSSEARRD